MNYWSEKSLQNEAEYAWAQDFLSTAGALAECKNHPGTFFCGEENIEDAYRLLNAQITAGVITLENGQSRKYLTDLLKSVYDDNSGLDACQECADHFGPD